MKRIVFILILVSFSLFAQSGGSFVFQPPGANFMLYSRGGNYFALTQNSKFYSAINKNINKLSSGKRINSAADDPSGLAVSEKMNSFIQGVQREAMNAADYRNYLKYKESVIAQNMNIVKRIRELAVQASNGILHPDDRALIQSEVDQLLSQIAMNARFSQFNTKQVIPDLTPANLGIAALSVKRDPYGAIKSCDAALKKLTRIRVGAGVKSNVLKLQIKGKYYYMVNMISSMSRITDLDMAEEFSDYSKNMVLYKTSNGMILMKKK